MIQFSMNKYEKRQIKLPSITKDWVHKNVMQIDTAVHVVLM